MGQKTVATIGVLTGCAMCCSLGGAFMSMHKVSFFTGYIIRAVRLETGLLTVEVDDQSSDFCRVFNKVMPGTCSSGTFMLQDVAQRFCAPMVKTLYSQACRGFQMAFMMGVAVIVVLAINATLCATATWLLYRYITSEKHKKSYRELSFILFLCGTVLLAVSLALYGFCVFKSLNEMRPRGLGVVGELVFKPSEGIGISWGYLSLILNIAVQVTIMFLFPLVKTSQELSADELEERKLAGECGGLEPGYGSADGPAAQMLPSPWAAQQPAASWGFGQPVPGHVQQAQAGFATQQPPQPPAW